MCGGGGGGIFRFGGRLPFTPSPLLPAFGNPIVDAAHPGGYPPPRCLVETWRRPLEVKGVHIKPQT
jgi:hypothetical protein